MIAFRSGRASPQQLAIVAQGRPYPDEPGGEPAGFYELDRRNRPVVNLSYFGLLPHAIGRGMSRALLRHAVEAAWAGGGTRAMTVNTCTADHPRALPNYIAAGFRPVRAVREVWQVPARLGLPIPERLKAG